MAKINWEKRMYYLTIILIILTFIILINSFGGGCVVNIPIAIYNSLTGAATGGTAPMKF